MKPSIYEKQECRWCCHSWYRHGRYGCDEIVGAGGETGACACTVQTPEHGEALDELERSRRFPLRRLTA